MDTRIQAIFSSSEMIHIRKAVQYFILLESSIDPTKAFKIMNSSKMKKIPISPFVIDWRQNNDPTSTPPSQVHRLKILHFDTSFDTIKKWYGVHLLGLTPRETTDPYIKMFDSIKIEKSATRLMTKFGVDPLTCSLQLSNGNIPGKSDRTIVNLLIETPHNLQLEKYTKPKSKDESSDKSTYTERCYFSDLLQHGFNAEKYRNTVYYLMDYLETMFDFQYNETKMEPYLKTEYLQFLKILNM
jgi:hypothetical protein